MTRSQLERAFLTAIRAAGDIPEPLVNQRLHGFEADFYWPEPALVVEIDDYLTHGDRLAFERDRRKQTAYALEGILTIRITEETLSSAVGTVRRLISDRSGRL
jgi:very-short-patch-repair endonuclease